MYTLTVYMLGGAQLNFQYKKTDDGTREKAEIDTARTAADQVGELISISDDYGRSAMISLEEIAATLGGDLAEGLAGSVEASIIQARAQSDAQSAAQRDPKLRFAASAMN